MKLEKKKLCRICIVIRKGICTSPTIIFCLITVMNKIVK